MRLTASARNCPIRCERRAPTAVRMPISRVRSVTVTSMMFMTPIPATSSAMLATAAASTWKSTVMARAERSSAVRV